MNNLPPANIHTDLSGDATDAEVVIALANKADLVHSHTVMSQIPADARVETVGITVDGSGLVLTSGVKGIREVKVASTIIGWTVIADQSGSVAFDIKKSSYSGFSGSLASIVASAAPALSSAQKNQDATLTGWTTTIAAGDILQFEITGTPATLTRATLLLHLRRT